MKLDLGCGESRLDGFLRVDCDPNVNPDLVWNLNVFPYPFRNKSVSHVRLSNILEHVLDPHKTLIEVYRILEDYGSLEIIVPHYSSSSAYKGNWEHIHQYSLNFMDYFKEYFIVKSVYLYWFDTSNHKDGKYYSLKNKIAPIINFIGNLHLRFTERIWLYWVGGFEEIKFICIKINEELEL